MEFLKEQVFHGPNRWAAVPVLETRVDIRSWRSNYAEREKRLREQLIQWLPLLAQQALPRSNVVGLVGDVQSQATQLDSSLRHGASVATMLAQVAQVLQSLAGVPNNFSEASETDEPHVYIVALEMEEEALAKACLETARRLCQAASDGVPFDIPTEVRQLVDLADDVRLGPSSRSIVRAAVQRGIPHRRLNSGSLVQLGEGQNQRRIWTAETDSTSAIAESIASDKELTKRLLRAVGVPVPQGRLATSPEDAWAAAQEIGVPVVVKPRNANHGIGVSLNLTTREQVFAAFAAALEEVNDSRVIVEQFATGRAHRLLVIGNRLVAAARGECETVVGDGHHTIAELVDEVNRDPRRGENYTDPLDVLKINANGLLELERQGLTPDSVPAAGQEVVVQPIGDLTTDVTDQVHPANAAHAVLAARTVGLDIAGMDLIAEDIRRPFSEQRGMILEVNAGPSLSMHIAPLHGKPQPVGEAIAAMLFAPTQTGRIPIVAVTGDGDRAAIVARIEQFWTTEGRFVGAATATEVRYAGQRVVPVGASEAERVGMLLTHSLVAAAVFESLPSEVAVTGLGSSRCELVVIVPSVVQGNGSALSAVESESVAGILAAVRAVPVHGIVLLADNDPLRDRVTAICRGRTLTWNDSNLVAALQNAVTVASCPI